MVAGYDERGGEGGGGVCAEAEAPTQPRVVRALLAFFQPPTWAEGAAVVISKLKDFKVFECVGVLCVCVCVCESVSTVCVCVCLYVCV